MTARLLFPSLSALSVLIAAACHDPTGMMSPADGATTSATDMMDKPDLTGHSPMLVELTDDGAIVLRRAAVVPLETCTDERIAEFEREGRRCRGIVTAQSRIFANSARLL